MIKRSIYLFSLLVSVYTSNVFAQQYNGTTGLIHIPTAEMNDAGDARIGAHFLNKELVPDKFLCPDDEGVKQKYNTFSYYFSITPFRWVEVAYTCVLFKYNQSDRKGYTAKDRHFALKLNPLYEGKYYPAIAIGGDDLLSSNLDAEQIQGYFANIWIAATKHFTFSGNELATHLGYRYYIKEWNKKYQGINGAVSFRPSFAPMTRAICEWDGTHVNVGIDALLFKHLLLQASLTNGTKPSAGICYQVNLFYKNKKNKLKKEKQQ